VRYTDIQTCIQTDIRTDGQAARHTHTDIQTGSESPAMVILASSLTRSSSSPLSAQFMVICRINSSEEGKKRSRKEEGGRRRGEEEGRRRSRGGG
jgi:hypothetical protein